MGACGLPEAHILFALGLADPLPHHIADYLRGPLQPIGASPPSPMPEHNSAVSGHTAAKAARLAELAYSPRSIGKLLAVPAKAVERYLRKRNLPIGEKRLRPTRSPWFATDPSEAWRYRRDGTRPAPTELPSTKALAAEAETDQVDAAEPFPSPPAWSGRSSS